MKMSEFTHINDDGCPVPCGFVSRGGFVGGGGINKATKEAEIASYWTSCSHISSPSFLLHTNTKIQSACKYKYVKSVMQIKCKC